MTWAAWLQVWEGYPTQGRGGLVSRPPDLQGPQAGVKHGFLWG